MSRRLFLKLAALLAAATVLRLPRVAWAETDFWILDVSALGVDTRAAAPDSPPVYRVWVPNVIRG